MAVGGGNGRATIREIAELAGVSIATVSRVMNGREDVSAETRELVQRIVRERASRPTPSSRSRPTSR
jgi:LacI family transcriptional regulator